MKPYPLPYHDGWDFPPDYDAYEVDDVYVSLVRKEFTTVAPFHEISLIFPPMSYEERWELSKDIEKNGQRMPIWITQDGLILDGDGIDIYWACFYADIKPKCEVWKGKGSPLEFVLSHRKYLSASQRAAIGFKFLLPLFESEAKDRQRGGQGGRLLVGIFPQAMGRARDQVAHLMHVDPTYISRVKKINETRPDLVELMWQGKLEMKDVKYILGEDHRQQMRIADDKRIARTDPPSVGEKKYSTIVIDPPWAYEQEGFVNVRVASVPYRTMSLEEIAALQVGDLAAENCHLYLWTTNLFLPKSFALLEAWGFKYATLLTWVKPRSVLSHWFLSKTEHVIFAVRGSLPPKRRNATTVITGDRPKLHSTKPEEFYKLVESFSPGPWFEWFARRKRPGWDSWGAGVSEGGDVPVLPGAPGAPDFERKFRAKVLDLG